MAEEDRSERSDDWWKNHKQERFTDVAEPIREVTPDGELGKAEKPKKVGATK